MYLSLTRNIWQHRGLCSVWRGSARQHLVERISTYVQLLPYLVMFYLFTLSCNSQQPWRLEKGPIKHSHYFLGPRGTLLYLHARIYHVAPSPCLTSPFRSPSSRRNWRLQRVTRTACCNTACALVIVNNSSSIYYWSLSSCECFGLICCVEFRLYTYLYRVIAIFHRTNNVYWNIVDIVGHSISDLWPHCRRSVLQRMCFVQGMVALFSSVHI